MVTDERLLIRGFVHTLMDRLEEMPRRRGDYSRMELRSVLAYWDNVDTISEVVDDPMDDWAEQLVDAFEEVAQR